jgi:asparagine synthase (glutamine-hydrolysing)
VLFNDRWGMQRLYYHETADSFYFAAEAKSVLSVRPELRSLDPRGLGEFVACGCVLENRTLFKGVHVLPAASAWTFESGHLKARGQYFHPAEWESQEPLTAEAYYRHLRETFSATVARQLESRNRVAVSLTGGLDSRMIMAWQKAPRGSLPCYSFSSTIRESQDVRLARKVARVCEQPHETIAVGREFLADFPRHAERAVYLSDGCTTAAHATDLYLSERTREIAPARVAGNYGGEVLRRVRAFKPHAPLDGLFNGDFQPEIWRTSETYRGIIDCHPLSFAVFRQAPWHHYALAALEATQLSVRSPFLDNELVRTVFRAPAVTFEDNLVSLRLIADGDPVLARIRTDRGVTAHRGRLAGTVSRVRHEGTFKAEYAYDAGMPQPLAWIDGLLRPLHLERLFLGRHKFAHFRVWYRDELAAYVQDMLLDSRTLRRPYLVKPAVEHVVATHVAGERNYTAEIHQLLTLELVSRLFVDTN